MLPECEEIIDVGQWADVRVRRGQMESLKKSLTLQAREIAGGGFFPQFREHEEADRLYIPRAFVKAGEFTSAKTWGTITTKSKLTTPRPGQAETIAKFLKGLSVYTYGGILQAVTGSGKTAMGLDIACTLGMTTLVIVPRTTLMRQWEENILKWTDARERDIGEVQGPRLDYAGKKFVVAMLHTLAQQRERFSADFLSYFGLVIVDECHVISAETFQHVAPLFDCKVRLGLSATPRRNDGLQNTFFWHLGPVLSKFEKLQAAPRFRIIPYYGMDTSQTGCVWAGKLNLGRYFNRVAASTRRLQLVAKLVKALNNKNEDILVLSDRLKHLEDIKNEIVKRGVDPARIGFLTSKKKQLDKKIILGTYGAASMGVDIPRLTALVLATPRADIVQSIGRVLRQGTPLVIDIVDEASKIMVGWSRHRMRHYATISKDIKVVGVKD